MVYPTRINDAYWENFSVKENDLEQLVSFLFDKESPLPTKDLVRALIKIRIAHEKKLEESRQSERGILYMPKDVYREGDRLVFPALEWKNGSVVSVREGVNPEEGQFNVITVQMEDGSENCFASNLENHKLNNPLAFDTDDKNSNEDLIISRFGRSIGTKLEKELAKSHELVSIGQEWFPKSMLIDFTQGHLNIAEAVLDMQGGGPMDTKSLLKQIDVDVSNNLDLAEFSLNYVLNEDPRFDEVGSKGVILWFLHRLEPAFVQDKPLYLHYNPGLEVFDAFSEEDQEMLSSLDDDLIPALEQEETGGTSHSLALIYPHWRSGTIPLTTKLRSIFPSSYQSERIKIILIDRDSNQEISGWVVRPFNYIYGLEKWYEDKALIPGSIINLERSEDPGIIYIQAQKRRSNREWIKTVLVGADGGIVIALLKQSVTAGFSERMAISIPDPSALDEIWNARKAKPKSLKQDVFNMMQELTKLNQQRHVHFLEIYAATNIIRRCPPHPLLYLLTHDNDFNHVGDYYFHLKEA